MAEIGRVRIRVPPTMKPGDVIRVRSIVMHPMEVMEREKDGKIIEKNYHFINAVIVTFNRKQVARFETTQAVSANPYFAFPLKVTEPGTLKIIFLDTHGGKYEGTAEITF